MSLGRSNSASSGTLKAMRRPRPLKIGTTTPTNRLSTAIELSSVEDIIVLVENITRQLTFRNYDYSVLASLLRLCESLKQSGPQLENLYQEQLDKLWVAIRNSCRDEELDTGSRVHLLEMIELRAMNWRPNETTSAYYRQKLSQLDEETGMVYNSPVTVELPTVQTAPVSLNMHGPDFSQLPTLGLGILPPGEILASSGRFAQPSRIPGKSYFKDEVVIRNADSGKVMGLKGRRVHMIEEITETVISFQRVVPGARERLVQITGPATENIQLARRLIEDTIRRNQSPVREEDNETLDGDSRRNTLIADRESQRSSTGISIHEYKYTVNVGDQHVKITGGSLDLVRTAKLVLDEYFSLTTSPATADTQYEDAVLSPGIGNRSSAIIKESAFSTMSRQPKMNLGPNHTKPSLIHQTTEIPETDDPPPGPEKSEKEAGTSPSLTYTRDQLLELSSSPDCKKLPEILSKYALDPVINIVRVKKSPFNGKEHVEKGKAIFRVDYARPFPKEIEDDIE